MNVNRPASNHADTAKTADAPLKHLRFLHGAPGNRGFALVVTVVMMVLLSLLGVAMLGLGSITLRQQSHAGPQRVASANARLALSMALAELQKTLGDDRRVTADAAILEADGGTAAGSRMVGVWGTPEMEFTENPMARGPDYEEFKSELFRRWLVSHPDSELLRDPGFPEVHDPGAGPALFTRSHDGFDLNGGLIPISGPEGNSGSYAWAVRQEATGAQINVGNAAERNDPNDPLHAPRRPNLSLTDYATQPESGWENRGGRVLSMSQALLDSAYGMDRSSLSVAARHHTTGSFGVLADVVGGGLKVDLSLGFELSDDEFSAQSLDGVPNPFAGGSAPRGEVPLYQPVNNGESVSVTTNYDAFSYTNQFHTGAPPTFTTLRSHYRLYRHLYESDGTPTTFSRPQSSTYYSKVAPRGGETGVNPVLDRLMMYMSIWVNPRNQVLHLVFTPIVTLWNPYNVALECEGFVIYPWMDFPLFADWQITPHDDRGGSYSRSLPISRFIGNKYADVGHGRQETPYFYFELTQDGNGRTENPIHLEPGEVRVFTPVEGRPREFERMSPNASEFQKYQNLRWRLRAAQGPSDVSLSGGVAIRMDDSPDDNESSEVQGPMHPSDQIRLTPRLATGGYFYHIAMEGAERINNPRSSGGNDRIADVQVYQGRQSDTQFTSSYYSAGELAEPQLVGVLETFHRTALQSDQVSDIVYTVNPRERYANAYLSGTDFAIAPHYESSMRPTRDLGQSIQRTPDGLRAYYGPSNSPGGGGRDRLSFFEIPESAPLSLASFQHANLADTAFSTGYPFGNSWASPYVPRNGGAKYLRSASTGQRIAPQGLGIYDHSFLLNQALWDGFYLSSIAPEVNRSGMTGSPGIFDSDTVTDTRDTDTIVREWLEDPDEAPLRNPRHIPYRGSLSDEEIRSRLSGSAGVRYAAAHMLLEGAFNVNSTSEEAWAAVLASLRGESFATRGGDTHNPNNATPAARMRNPTGTANDQWDGFRELSDREIESLAEQIVREVRERGPFQSLAEFVNRRLTSDEHGLKGALQAAIDNAGLNADAGVATFNARSYTVPSNLPNPDTGTATPGWLTQADLLTALAPVITVRSDTFTVRGYGEARDASGEVVARAWCEAVVQRTPEYIDPVDEAIEPVDQLDTVNARLGRRFQVVSFREVSKRELLDS